MASRSTQFGAQSLIAAAALLLAACPSVHYIPLDTENVTIFEEERAASRTQDIGLTVAYEPLDWASGGVAGQIMAFHVALRNYGDLPIPVLPEHFLLFDGEGNQFSAVTPEQMQVLLQHDYPRFGVGVGLGYGRGFGRHDPWHYGLGWRHGFHGFNDGYYGPDGGSFREIFGRSLFPAAPLQPGARQRGLVYFRGDAEGRDPIYLEVRIPGRDPQRFPFTMIRR